jgi:NADH dehydrogenase
VQLVLTQIGRKRLLLPFPYFAWEALAALPNRPVSRDQVRLMKKDNVVSAQALTLAALGIEPTPVEVSLPTYLG